MTSSPEGQTEIATISKPQNVDVAAPQAISGPCLRKPVNHMRPHRAPPRAATSCISLRWGVITADMRQFHAQAIRRVERAKLPKGDATRVIGPRAAPDPTARFREAFRTSLQQIPARGPRKARGISSWQAARRGAPKLRFDRGKAAAPSQILPRHPFYHRSPVWVELRWARTWMGGWASIQGHGGL